MEISKQQSEIKMRHLPTIGLSDTFYSAKKRYASKARLKCATYRRYSLVRDQREMEICKGKARLKCATYRRYTDLSVMGVRVGVATFFSDLGVMGVRVGVATFFGSIERHENCGRRRFGQFVGVRVGMAYSRSKLRCV